MRVSIRGSFWYTDKMKRKVLISVILVCSVILVALVLYKQQNALSSEKSGIITDYGPSICTQDIPSSDCGAYDVTLQAIDGKKTTYKVAGFSNRVSKLYDELGANIFKAKEQKTQVTLKVNNKNEIISVQ